VSPGEESYKMSPDLKEIVQPGGLRRVAVHIHADHKLCTQILFRGKNRQLAYVPAIHQNLIIPGSRCKDHRQAAACLDRTGHRALSNNDLVAASEIARHNSYGD